MNTLKTHSNCGFEHIVHREHARKLTQYVAFYSATKTTYQGQVMFFDPAHA